MDELDLEQNRRGHTGRDTADQAERRQHTGDRRVLFRHGLRRVHHAQTAQVTVSEAHEAGAQDEHPLARDQQRVGGRLEVAEQEERNEQRAQQDRDPEVLRRWGLEVVRRDVADHREQVEVQEAADRREERVVEEEVLVRSLDRRQNGRKQQQSDEEGEKHVEALDAAVLQDVHVGRSGALGHTLVFGRVESVEVL